MTPDGTVLAGIGTAELRTNQVPAGQGDAPLREALAAGGAAYAVIAFHLHDVSFRGVAASSRYLNRFAGPR